LAIGHERYVWSQGLISGDQNPSFEEGQQWQRRNRQSLCVRMNIYSIKEGLEGSVDEEK
jgi:hypothetical protein